MTPEERAAGAIKVLVEWGHVPKDHARHVEDAIYLTATAAVEAERAACEQAVRDSGVKIAGTFACAFETIEAAIEAIKARGKA